MNFFMYHGLINQLNATNLNFGNTRFQFHLELSLAQLSPDLFNNLSFVYYLTCQVLIVCFMLN